MKKIMMLILLTGSLMAQQKLFTLEESVRIGLENSKDLKIAGAKTNSADYKLSEVNSMFLPQFNILGNYTRLSDNIPAFEVTLPFSPSPVRIADPIYDNYTFKIGFSQPLFTGFKLLSSRNAAKYNLKAEEYDYSKEKNETAFGIQTAFWNYYKTAEIKKVVEQTLIQIENHLNDTRNFYSQGLVSNNDVLKLEVQYSNTKLLLIDAENNLNISKMAFNKALGFDLGSQTNVVVNPNELQTIEFNEQDLLNEALINRNELKSLSFRVEGSKENIKAAWSELYPSVYLTGNYYYSNPNPRYQPAVNEFNNNWDVGVTLSWNFWDWGKTSSKVSQAEQTKIQLETNYDMLKENIQMEVQKNYFDLLKNEEKISVNKIALEQAKENYRITAEKFDLQIASSTDLIDAESLKLQAETNLKTAEVDYQIAKANLLKSLGRNIF